MSVFERLYAASEDPWRFATSSYETGRHRTTLAALRRGSYRRAFEPGCSIGGLTTGLAQRCESVVATELVAAAVATARRRCAAFANVEIRQADVAVDAPPGRFDLIVFSEIGYYFEPTTLAGIIATLTAALEPGGEFLAVHWLGRSADHVLHGDAVHYVLGTHLTLDWIGGARHPEFRLDCWRRP
jgi:cyclopropane fatty-acyl-phospholipid synthase-like methyltransferase